MLGFEHYFFVLNANTYNVIGLDKINNYHKKQFEYYWCVYTNKYQLIVNLWMIY
jgi:hypothetical protein